LRSIRDAGPKCPVDNQYLDELQLTPDYYAMREMLNHAVFCKLCPWRGPLRKLEDHSKECDFVAVSCPKNCGKEFQRKDLKQHLKDDCPNRTIFCDEEVLWNSMEVCCCARFTILWVLRSCFRYTSFGEEKK